MKSILKHYQPQGEMRYVMTTKKKLTQRDAILSDVIHCSVCGTSMVVKQANYVCANAGQHPTFCPAVEINAEILGQQIITTLVNRVMTPRTLSDIVERIQLDVADKARTQQGKFDNAETAIEELNIQKLGILSQVEYGEATYQDVVFELDTIESAHAGLVYESIVSRNEIDKLDFVASEEAISFVAQDIGTYTEFAKPELAKELVNTFIQDIRVGATTFEVTYTHPIPGEAGDALVTSDTFLLP